MFSVPFYVPFSVPFALNSVSAPTKAVQQCANTLPM